MSAFQHGGREQMRSYTRITLLIFVAWSIIVSACGQVTATTEAPTEEPTPKPTFQPTPETRFPLAEIVNDEGGPVTIPAKSNTPIPSLPSELLSRSSSSKIKQDSSIVIVIFYFPLSHRFSDR